MNSKQTIMQLANELMDLLSYEDDIEFVDDVVSAVSCNATFSDEDIAEAIDW